MDLEQTGICHKKAKYLKNLISLFLSDKKMSVNTIKTYRTILEHFAERMPPEIEQMRLEAIERYFLFLASKYKGSSQNLHLAAIKSFYKWAEGIGVKNPVKNMLPMPALPPDQRVLSHKEYNQVCLRVNGFALDCFRFLCNTGLRATEFITLTRHNLSGSFLRIVGKGRRNRSIPLNKTSIEIVQKYPDFEMIRRRNRLWLFRLCKRIGVEAEIASFHPHSCRHYFANELYHRGVDMYTISRLLGHADTKVTENVYVHWSEESLKGSTDILD